MIKTTIELVKEEREHQINNLGYTVLQDKTNNDEGQLIDAATCLASNIPDDMLIAYIDVNKNYPPNGWDTGKWEKMLKKSYSERLIIAASLLVAEYDRVNEQ